MHLMTSTSAKLRKPQTDRRSEHPKRSLNLGMFYSDLSALLSDKRAEVS